MTAPDRVLSALRELRSSGRDSLDARAKLLGELEALELGRWELVSWHLEHVSIALERRDLAEAARRVEEALAALPDVVVIQNEAKRIHAIDRVSFAMEAVEARAGRLSPEATDEVLAKFDPETLQIEERVSYYAFRGHAAMHRKDHPAALRFYREGMEACPDSAELKWSYAMQLEVAGEVERALELLRPLHVPRISISQALVGAHLAALHGRPEIGVEIVRPLVEQTLAGGVFDSTFLFMRGIRGFPHLWRCWYVLCRLAGGEHAARVDAQLAKHRHRFREDGLDDLAREQEGGAAWLPFLRSSAYRFGILAGEPEPYARYQVAAAHAKPSKSALATIERLTLSEIEKRAVLASIAYALGDRGLEKSHLDHIRPEHLQGFALSSVAWLGLVPYWERLRQIYVARAK